jgi:hypothetical protein
MALHIALIVDSTGRYAHVYGEARTFNRFIDQLEDIGCEVVENQTEDWDGCDMSEIAEDCISVQQLLGKSDYVSHY